ncbi:glycosyltransferase family 39 protein [Gordoniibacillus kamchatkensis]|uniref:glycosyltransferase family 39 protein n=1 Tax=Gordoniibacillus kamchatkensis TaxID=1590651 RepID=UPI000696152F|nr:glycosyltransferase family 39 protein [Paenibacillus sp. VKM B-2647]
MEGINLGGGIVKKLLLWAGTIFFALTLYFSFINSAKYLGGYVPTAALLALVVLVVVLAAHLLARRLTQKQFIILLLLVGFGFRVYWILLIDTPPVSDFLDMHNAALQAAKGDFSFGRSEYYSRWVYQLGFTIYEALIVKLFGAPIIILKLFNAVFNVGTAFVVYLTAAKLFNELSGRIASFLYALYVPNIIMCSVLTNQHVSTFFFSLGCYLLVRKGLVPKYSWIWVGLLFALGNMMSLWAFSSLRDSSFTPCFSCCGRGG